jgi:uncharacterized protein (DUF1778 family)
MKRNNAEADTTIHRARDTDLIDESIFHVDAEGFQKIVDWMDAPATASETDGMRRILQSKAPWQSRS